MSLDFQIQRSPAGGLRLSLRAETFAAVPEAVSAAFLALIPGPGGFFLPVSFFGLGTIVLSPGVPIELDNVQNQLPPGLYGVLAFELGRTVPVNASFQWFEPGLVPAESASATPSRPLPTLEYE